MKNHLLHLALLAICLFPTQAQSWGEFMFGETELVMNEEAVIFEPEDPADLAIPVPVYSTVSYDQGAANLHDSAYELILTGGRVAIRNNDGSASIVNAVELADSLFAQAGSISQLGTLVGNNIKITLPGGGKVPFIYIGPNEENTTQEANPTFQTRTVNPKIAPGSPPTYPQPASYAASFANSAVSKLNGITGYVVTTNSDGTYRVVNANNLAQEAQNQANILSAIGDYAVTVPNLYLNFEVVERIEGFSPVYGVILPYWYNGSVGVIIQQETNSSPTLIFVDATVMGGYYPESFVPANVAVSTLRDSSSRLKQLGGYVAVYDSNGQINVAEASKVASDLDSRADDFSKLGTIPVQAFGQLYQFQHIAKVEGIPSVDGIVLNWWTNERSVTLVRYL